MISLPVWAEARLVAAAVATTSVAEDDSGEAEENQEVFRAARMSQEAMKDVVGEFLLED